MDGEGDEDDDGEEEGGDSGVSEVDRVVGGFLGDGGGDLVGDGSLGCFWGWSCRPRGGVGAHVTLRGTGRGCLLGELRWGA